MSINKLSPQYFSDPDADFDDWEEWDPDVAGGYAQPDKEVIHGILDDVETWNQSEEEIEEEDLCKLGDLKKYLERQARLEAVHPPRPLLGDYVEGGEKNMNNTPYNGFADVVDFSNIQTTTEVTENKNNNNGGFDMNSASTWSFNQTTTVMDEYGNVRVVANGAPQTAGTTPQTSQPWIDTSTQAYGAPAPVQAAPAYGAPAQNTTPAWGAPAPAQAAPAYGAPVQTTPAYGAPAYGAPAPAQTTPAWGAPAPAQVAPAQTAPPAWGAPAPAQTTPAYGAPAQTAPPAWGAPAPAQTAPVSYGAPAQTTPAWGAPAPAQTAPVQTTPAWGAPAPAQTAPPAWGTPTQPVSTYATPTNMAVAPNSMSLDDIARLDAGLIASLAPKIQIMLTMQLLDYVKTLTAQLKGTNNPIVQNATPGVGLWDTPTSTQVVQTSAPQSGFATTPVQNTVPSGSIWDTIGTNGTVNSGFATTPPVQNNLTGMYSPQTTASPTQMNWELAPTGTPVNNNVDMGAGILNDPNWNPAVNSQQTNQSGYLY